MMSTYSSMSGIIRMIERIVIPPFFGNLTPTLSALAYHLPQILNAGRIRRTTKAHSHNGNRHSLVFFQGRIECSVGVAIVLFACWCRISIRGVERRGWCTLIAVGCKCDWSHCSGWSRNLEYYDSGSNIEIRSSWAVSICEKLCSFQCLFGKSRQIRNTNVATDTAHLSPASLELMYNAG